MEKIFLNSLGITLFIYIIYKIRNYYYFKNKFKYWEIGDEIYLFVNKVKIFNPEVNLPNNKHSFELYGWNKNKVFLNINGRITYIEMKCVDFNNTAIWRKYFDDCYDIMGKSPNFKRNNFFKNINNDEPKKDDILDGKSIDSLTETECQVYLKIVIKQENYELAEKIKKQMEKFR